MKTLDLVMQKLVVFYWKNSLLLERSITLTASSSVYPEGHAASAGRAGRVPWPWADMALIHPSNEAATSVE